MRATTRVRRSRRAWSSAPCNARRVVYAASRPADGRRGTDMAIDRQGTGLAILRIMLGVFFVFEGLGKLRWFVDASILAGRLADWNQAAGPGSIAGWYLSRIAIPGVSIFARLVPFGELAGGLALIVGFWTPLVAFLAFIMVLNIH